MSPRVLFLAFAMVAAPAGAGTSWPQFRGPASGHADGAGLPLAWSEDSNVVWKVPIAGRGYSSPVVAGGQVWLTTAIEEKPSLRAIAVDAASGEILIDVEAFSPAAWQPSHLENSYASPTPAIEPGRVYVHFGTYGTASLATDDGRVLWRNDELKIDHEMGPGSSPILWRELLFVNCDGMDQHYVAALEKETGEIVWRARRSVPLAHKNGPHRKAFSTPIVIEDADGPLLISSGADQVNAYDPHTGREVWRVRFEGYSVVPQPVAGNGRVYVDTGYMKPHLLAIRLGGRGDVTETHVEWSYHWQVPANPTPLLIGDDRIFMVSDWGIATWLDTVAGEDVWRQRLGGRYWASPLHTGDRIYLWSASGKTTVMAAGDEYRELATSQLDGEIRTTPAVAGGSFFVRSTTHLYRIAELDREGLP